MPANLILFQSDLSLTDFLQQYGTIEQCHSALFKLRWPKDFSCQKCRHVDMLIEQQLYQCNRCHHKFSLTTKTIFYRSKLPLTTWFLAIYLLAQSENRLTILQLARALGVCCSTAWKLKHKIMHSNLLSSYAHYRV